MEYVFGSTFVCKTMDAAKEVWPSLLKDLSRLFECVRIIGDRKLWWGGGGCIVITLTI